MRKTQRTATAVGAVVVASFALAYANRSLGDYPSDAGPTIGALLDGHLREALASQPLMGSLAVLVRMPFAALAQVTGGGELAVYRLGCVPCLVALGVAGLALAREMSLRGVRSRTAAAAAAIVLVNPLTWEAIRLGHPEELLAAAMVLFAGLAVLRDRPVATGVALGLALVSKQWAAIAVLPVLAAAPARRIRIGAVAGAVALVLTLPLLIGDLTSFYHSSRLAGWAGERVHPFNALWPLAPTEDRVISVAGHTKIVTVHVVPTWFAHLVHPAIVLLSIPFTAAWVALRRRRDAVDVFALLGLLFLLRCLLDPVDNAYYHVPFVACLACWEALSLRRAPVLALLASLAVYFMIYKAHVLGVSDLRNAGYLAATVPFGIWLGLGLFGRRGRGSFAVAPAPGRALPTLPLDSSLDRSLAGPLAGR
jgi:hypothetical protein